MRTIKPASRLFFSLTILFAATFTVHCGEAVDGPRGPVGGKGDNVDYAGADCSTDDDCPVGQGCCWDVCVEAYSAADQCHGNGVDSSEPDSADIENKAQAAKDADVFDGYCATCHGTAGDGNGPAAYSIDPKPADFQDPTFWENRTEADIRRVIVEGGSAVGKSPLMARWGAILNSEQLDATVRFVLSKKPH
jgi:mono/diheme cytochrome c family protein